MEQGVAARQQPYNPLSQLYQFVTLTKSYQTTTTSSQSPIAPGTTPSINRFTYSLPVFYHQQQQMLPTA